LAELIRCLALILLATTLLADAAVVQGDTQQTLQKQQDPKDIITDRTVSEDLFAELEESARLADIAYCVGTTGIHNPFGCLSHCEEFKGFELITVSVQIFKSMKGLPS
jgi:triacylglycerol lipase